MKLVIITLFGLMYGLIPSLFWGITIYDFSFWLFIVPANIITITLIEYINYKKLIEKDLKWN